MLRSACLLALATIVACSSKGGDPAPSADAAPGLFDTRPYQLLVPDSYDKSKPTPFVFMMHGYGASGQLEEIYMGISQAAQAHGFLYAYADGTKNKSGALFWNATDACCNFDGSTVDDVAYIDAVLADVSSKYNVDAKRFYLVGHSNGGFMAHRYACDRASKVAAIVSLAGAQWEDVAKCGATEPVSVLQVHGDQDTEVLYGGGSNKDASGVEHPYPSAHDTVARWATKDGCTGAIAATGTTLDIDVSITGNETVEEAYAGCPAGIDVRLWTMKGAGHVPALGPSWGESIWGFLGAHAKP